METITLPRFLKIVDGHIRDMSHEELEMLIHEIAATVPEAKRDKFILMLDKITDSKAHNINDLSGEERDKVAARVRGVMTKLEKIRAGEIRLESKINEKWSDWYNRDAEKLLFSDPDKLIKDIQEAIRLLRKCVDHELLDPGSRLCELLCNMVIFSDVDYDEHSEITLSIKDLYERGLLSGGFDVFAKDALFLTYLGSHLDERAGRLYDLFIRFDENVCLKDIIRMGKDELPEFDDFLKHLIEYVGRQSGDWASRLLEEAQSMIRDEDILLDNARKLVDTHPELYLQLLRMRTENRDDRRRLSIGLEAMDRIPENMKIRGETALITSCYAGRLGLEDIREKCWLEALRSDTTAINYMRIKFLASDEAKYEEEISLIVESVLAEINNSKDIYSVRVENEKENRIVLNDLCVMLFFEKRFSDMEAVGMPGEGNQFRSAAFMEAGVAFVLLLLSFGDDYSAGMDEMIIRAMEACNFSKIALCQGIEFNDNKADKECFLEIFDRWKGTVSLSEEEELIWIGKLERWVNRIIVGMMQGINSRDHYGKCAAFIAAFGEVKEDLFEVGAKDSILRHYKEMYPRRRVFHEELRRYGNGKKNNCYRFSRGLYDNLNRH